MASQAHSELDMTFYNDKWIYTIISDDGLKLAR